jgi:5-carboxymethyl-2-hydroxymuconate isomerase
VPHLTIEYSSNLEHRADLDALCGATLHAILASPVFEIGAARVRAVRCDHYAIADELAENAFVHMTFRIGAGRTQDEKRQVGERIFAAAKTVLAPLLQTPHFGLSLEIREIDPELSWKQNTMHARLRGAAQLSRS